MFVTGVIRSGGGGGGGEGAIVNGGGGGGGGGANGEDGGRGAGGNCNGDSGGVGFSVGTAIKVESLIFKQLLAPFIFLANVFSTGVTFNSFSPILISNAIDLESDFGVTFGIDFGGGSTVCLLLGM